MRAFAAAILALGLSMTGAASQGAPTPPACGGRSLAADLARTDPAALERALNRTRAEVPNAEGLLWRIQRAGVPDSHLFGTMHTTDRRALDIPAPVRDALRQARVVAVEQADLLRPGPTAQALGQRLVQMGLDQSGQALTFLSDQYRQAVETALSERGIPAEAARLFRPWFVNVLLASPLCEQRRASSGLINVDATIADTRPPGAELVSLETVEEQITALRTIPEDVSRHSLSWTARHIARMEDIYATLLDLYVQRRPVALLDIAVGAGLASEDDRVLQLRFIRALGETRDKVMAERALPLLARGQAFIAVGALHLPGTDGLVERFRRAGYTVTRVW